MVNEFPFPFFVVNLIFVIVDKVMYARSNFLDGHGNLFLSIYKVVSFVEKNVIFLSSQPSPMLSVIPLIVGMFPSENSRG
jgi:hypothetical protein